MRRPLVGPVVEGEVDDGRVLQLNLPRSFDRHLAVHVGGPVALMSN